jgi:hypothetical protein
MRWDEMKGVCGMILSIGMNARRSEPGLKCYDGNWNGKE